MKRLSPAIAILAGLFGAAFSVSLAWSAGSPNVASIGACTSNAQGFCFGAPPMPATLRNINYNAPSAGSVQVTVSGSGWCVFLNNAVEETADFQTQIQNTAAVANYKGPGGLRIKLKQLGSAGAANPVTVPFNLASSRVFNVPAGMGTYRLAARIIKFDDHVACYAAGITMSVLFFPQ